MRTKEKKMSAADILNRLMELSLSERLTVLEDALHQIREELAGREPEAIDAQLSAAAASLLSDYAQDAELTAFT
jgi:ribosomal protein L7/L12